MMVLTIWFLMNRQGLPTAAALSVGEAPGVNHFSAGHFLTRHFQSDCGGEGTPRLSPLLWSAMGLPGMVSGSAVPWKHPAVP